VEVVKREQGLQSNQLPADLKEKVEGAVESLDFRVTAGDVAAKAGVKLADAESALQVCGCRVRYMILSELQASSLYMA
jgi:hypothetical protein